MHRSDTPYGGPRPSPQMAGSNRSVPSYGGSRPDPQNEGEVARTWTVDIPIIRYPAQIQRQLAQTVLREVLVEAARADGFAIIVEGTTYITQREQMSICLRFVTRSSW